MSKLNCEGKIEVNVSSHDDKQNRIAVLEVRFGNFIMNPPANHVKKKIKNLPNLKLTAIYVREKSVPIGEEALEWMLLTNMKVNNVEEAIEKVKWYGLRWRIETFHKILKSGLKVEECRLGTAERLMRYLTVMSIIAWRIFYITLIARTESNLPCTYLLAEEEWKVLYTRMKHTKIYPDIAPTIREAVRWIAQLGGFLARKGDGEPGPITLWRGWRKLFDLTEGWKLAVTGKF